MLGNSFLHDDKWTFEQLKMSISYFREQKIKQAHEKVKYVLNVPFLHMTNALYEASSLSSRHIINPVWDWTGSDLVGHSEPSSAYNNLPWRALSRRRKSRERSPCLSSLSSQPGRGVWLIVQTWLTTLHDIQSDKIAITWALSRHKSPLRYGGICILFLHKSWLSLI